MKNQYGVTVGEYVTVGHSVTLHGCVVEDRCLIGMGSVILNGAKIGAGSIIAAGTLIPERTVVEPRSLWMGSPGKFKRKLDAGEEETIMRYARNYLGYTEEYLAGTIRCRLCHPERRRPIRKANRFSESKDPFTHAQRRRGRAFSRRSRWVRNMRLRMTLEE